MAAALGPAHSSDIPVAYNKHQTESLLGAQQKPHTSA